MAGIVKTLQFAEGTVVDAPTVSGSGAGEKNYVTAGSNASGWTAVGDLAVSTSTTASELPREYTTASGIKIVADADTQSTADYVYYDFTLDDVDLNKKLKIKWDQKTTGTYAAGDLAVIITTQADRTTALHTPITTAIPSADGQFQTSFDTGSTATLSLVIRATTDMATNGGIVISDVVVGPGIQPQGAVVTEWQTVTVTGSWSTNTTYTAVERRVGSDAEYEIHVALSGAPDSAALTVNLPRTIDTTKLAVTGGLNPLGRATLRDSGTATYPCRVVYNGTTAVAVHYIDDAAAGVTSAAVTQAAPITLASGDFVVLRFSVPIAEWAGSGTVNLAQNDVEYAYNSGTWDATDSTSFAYGPAGQALAGALTAARTKRVRFQTPMQADDMIVLEFSDDRVGWIPAAGGSVNQTYIIPGYSATGAEFAGAYIKRVTSSTTDVDVAFGRYAQMANDDAPTADWPNAGYWRVKKVKGGQAVGFGKATKSSNGLVTSYAPTVQSAVYAVSSADYTILDTDGYETINVTTGSSNRTITLPTAADNTGRTLVIKKVDSGTGNVVIDGESSETIDSDLTHTLYIQHSSLRITCDGTAWRIINKYVPQAAVSGGTISSGTWTPDFSKASNFYATATGDFTINPSNVATGQIGYITVLASGASRTITLSRSAAYALEPYSVTISSGKRALFQVVNNGDSYPMFTFINAIS